MNKKSVLNRLSSLKTPLMAVGVSQLGDVVTKKGLSPYIGETILKEVEYV